MCELAAFWSLLEVILLSISETNFEAPCSSGYPGDNILNPYRGGETTVLLWVNLACLLWAVVQPGLLAAVVSPRNPQKLFLCSVINHSFIIPEREVYGERTQLGNCILKSTSWSSQVPSWSLLLALPGS